jgi:hypothetical protein
MFIISLILQGTLINDLRLLSFILCIYVSYVPCLLSFIIYVYVVLLL